MINQKSIDTVRAARTDANHARPMYESYSFARLPATIRRLLVPNADGASLPADVLTGLPDQYDKVILVLIDAFGWRFVEPYLAHDPFLRRVVSEGTVSMLTSQFPSTTAAHITTLGTGLPVGTSGVFEWFYYEPTVDRVIAPLMFSFAGDKMPGTLQAVNADPRRLYPTETIPQKLAAEGVRAFTFQDANYAFSPYSQAIGAGAKMLPFKTPAEALINLADRTLNTPGKAYFFLYIDTFDALLHHYGPGAPQVTAEIEMLLWLLEKHLHSGLSGKAHKTLLLLIADHGQIEVAPEQTIYLNQRDPSLVELWRTNGQGQPIVPAGSSRDMFLYVKPERLIEAQERLTTLLGEDAEVRRVSELIAQGYFGTTTPSPAFMSRVADLVILPRPHQMVWWYEQDKFEQKFRGHHGGLTPQEMEIALLALAYP
ncbi:MAG: alkaline phosphatase family protein [Aggregatilineales bacterium]